mmetsp:Transcript_8605/g.19187  ORF Transcript_8605/g.19187 Transcript_8605/m.19187 type:complete len:990 (+) Transcript_8605:165-3134(+)
MPSARARGGFASFAASAKPAADTAAPADGPLPAAGPSQPGRPPPPARELSLEEAKGVLEALRTASMRPDFQKQLQDLKARDDGATKKRQAFAKILAAAWKAPMREHSFKIDEHGFPQLVNAIRAQAHQPGVRTISEEVERQLKFVPGALFGANAGRMKGTFAMSATAKADTSKGIDNIVPEKETVNETNVRGRMMGLGEAKELLKAFRECLSQKDSQKKVKELHKKGPAAVNGEALGLMANLWNPIMKDFDYPLSKEAYEQMFRDISKHGWNLHVRQEAHQVERLWFFTAGSLFKIPADEAREAEEEQMIAAGNKKKKAKASDPGPGEILVLVQHAVEKSQIRVVVPEGATFRAVKEGISKLTGREDILQRGRLVQRRGGTYSSYQDSAPIGQNREVLVLGADLSVDDDGGDSDSDDGDAPTLHAFRPTDPPPPSASAGQGKAKKEGEWAGSAQPQAFNVNAQVKAPSGPAPPQLSKDQVHELQKDLIAGFKDPNFQMKLQELGQQLAKGTPKYNAERNKLFLTVQKVILPKYGFRGDPKGVWDMMNAFEPYMQDPTFGHYGYEINVWCGLAEPTPGHDPRIASQPAQAPQPAPTPTPARPEPPKPQPPKPQPTPAPAVPKPAPPPPAPEPPPQPAEKPPEEVEVTIEHAINEDSAKITMRIMDNATILELRRAIMAKLGEKKLSEVKVVAKTENNFTTIPDDRTVGTKRAFLTMGRSLDGAIQDVAETVKKSKTPEVKKEEDIELVVHIDPSKGWKTTLKVKPGISIWGVKTELAKSDKSGNTKAQEVKLKLPGQDAQLKDHEKLKGDTKELHIWTPPAPAPPVVPAMPAGEFTWTAFGVEQVKGSPEAFGFPEDGSPFTAEHFANVFHAHQIPMDKLVSDGVVRRGKKPAAPAPPPPAPAPPPPAQEAVVEFTLVVFIDRSLDLSSTVEIKSNMTIQEIKERIAADDPTGGTKPEDFGLQLTGGRELRQDEKLPGGVKEVDICIKGM